MLMGQYSIERSERITHGSQPGIDGFGTRMGWRANGILELCRPADFGHAAATAQNFAIGLQATEVDNSKEARSGAKSTFNSIVNTSMIDMKYKDQPINGTGWTEQTAGTVVPSSLYYYQLRDRLGKSALKKVMDEPQYNKYFNR